MRESGMRKLMRLTERLIKLLEESGVSEIEVSRWGRRVKVVKYAQEKLPPTAPRREEMAVPAPELSPEVSYSPEETPKDEGLQEIHSPMVGMFYQAPAPGADPYVKEGDLVTVGQIVCIIEAMKIMNEIESPVEGEIVRILVGDAQPVEYNQTLFLVRPL